VADSFQELLVARHSRLDLPPDHHGFLAVQPRSGRRGWGAFWYHLVNLLLHALNVWLVWKLAARLLSSRAAWFAAALFAVHPIATEAVDNVVGRADLLAAMAVLAGLLIYGRATAQSGARAGWRYSRWQPRVRSRKKTP